MVPTEVGIGPIGMDAAAFEVERRLQHLEEAESTIRSELQHVRRCAECYRDGMREPHGYAQSAV